MKCDDARRAYSVAIDGELAAADREQLDAHMSSCPSCTAHAARLVRVRQQLRFEPVEDVPDVLPRVLGSRPGRRRPTLLVLAATFVACFVAGASFVGFGPDRVPTPMAYADIRDGLPSAQRQVRSLHTTLRIVERGWHPRVPVREYAGTFDYAAPESLWLRLRDRTKYPSAPWARNDVDLVVDRDSAWWRGPAPCPVELQPSCTPANARVQAFSGRDPFSETAPAPLDLVVPVRSFTGAASAPVIGTRRIAGREALEIRVGAAQVAPLLDALRRAGNWREINPADSVELWLDADHLVPLELKVFPADTADRAAWARRRGYTDIAGVAVLEMHVVQSAFNEATDQPYPGPPDGARVRDIGFRDRDTTDAPAPAPGGGMRAYRIGEIAGDGSSGAPTVSERSWTDGRAWVRVRSTRNWDGGRLFGSLGPDVRPVAVGGGFAYVSSSPPRVALHAAGIDIAVDGSFGLDDLLAVTRDLGFVGLPVPPDWDEGRFTDVLPSGALLAQRLEGFAQPSVRVVGDTATFVYAGPGDRLLVMVQSPGSVLSPPTDNDARGVIVHGVTGRYSPERGELEWTKDGRIVSLTSRALGLGELVQIADRLP